MVSLDVSESAPARSVSREQKRKSVMLPLIGRRVLVMIPTLFGIVTITFILTHALGGNPARQIAGQAADPATIAHISHEYGFDHPLIVQYWRYLTGLLHGDLGVSTTTNEPVLHDLLVRFPSTLELISLSLTVALAIGIPLGAYAGRTRRAGPQMLVRSITFVTLAVPDFWLALVAIWLFFFSLGWLPSPTGQVSLGATGPNNVTGAALLDSVLTGDVAAFKDSFMHLVLPVGVLGLLLSAPITRLMRASMITAMESDFMRFGTAVGLGRARLWRYAVRSSVPTIVTFTGTLFTLLLGGVVLIESVFSWGGAAQYAASSVQRNDFAATQGFVLVCGVLAMLAFLIVDIIQLKLDPRIRVSPSAGSMRRLMLWRSREEVVQFTEVTTADPIADPTVPTSVSAGVPAAAPSALPVGNPPRSSIVDGARDVFALMGEIVRDARPQRWPRATWRTLRTGNVALLVGAAIVVLLIAAAFIVPMFWKYGALTPDAANPLAPPSAAHPFGTDNSGFDLFIRVIVAARTDLWIAAAGVGISAVIGVGLGLLVGYSRSRTLDDIVMRVVDMIQAFPVLIVAIALVAFAGNSLTNVIWALAFINIPIFLRLARGQVLSVREQRYVEAAAAMGNSRARILVRHVLPNITGQAVVQVGISLGYALLTVAGLAFLGVGVQAPTAEWGSMILTGKDNISTGQWWTVTFPGLAILVAVAGFNLLADGIERHRDIYR